MNNTGSVNCSTTKPFRVHTSPALVGRQLAFQHDHRLETRQIERGVTARQQPRTQGQSQGQTGPHQLRLPLQGQGFARQFAELRQYNCTSPMATTRASKAVTTDSVRCCPTNEARLAPWIAREISELSGLVEQYTLLSSTLSAWVTIAAAGLWSRICSTVTGIYPNYFRPARCFCCKSAH